MGDSHQLPDRALGSQSKPLKRHRAALCFRLFALARDWCDLGAVTLPLSVGLGPWPPQGTPPNLDSRIGPGCPPEPRILINCFCPCSRPLPGRAPVRYRGAPVRRRGAPLRRRGAPARRWGAPARCRGASVRCQSVPVCRRGAPVRRQVALARRGAPVRRQGALAPRRARSPPRRACSPPRRARP